MDHECDDRCSWRQDEESLTRLGFAIRKTDKIAGCTYLVQAGMSFEAARHEAWIAGHTRLCTRNPRNMRSDMGARPSWAT